jgi:hypothetical protein
MRSSTKPLAILLTAFGIILLAVYGIALLLS